MRNRKMRDQNAGPKMHYRKMQVESTEPENAGMENAGPGVCYHLQLKRTCNNASNFCMCTTKRFILAKN